MLTNAIPDRVSRKTIQKNTHAEANLCWTCGTCDSECPVNLATGWLRPQKIVRMANLGFLDDLRSLQEIWYCQTCKRCNYVCPNLVKPASIISFFRKEALRANRMSWEMFLRLMDLLSRFQRVRWRAAELCLQGDLESISQEKWRNWFKTPIESSRKDILHATLSPSRGFKGVSDNSNSTACFTCSECSNVCPIFFERSVFDPQKIFRMVNFGMEEELLKSPSIWLCIACQRCSDACGQLVSGHLMIQRLQELAVREDIVDSGFPYRWKQGQKAIYPFFVKEINELFGLNPIDDGKPPTRMAA